MIIGKKISNGILRPKVLVAPLDWGLGHATRCIPIIKELTDLNCEVLIVADKHIYSLLKKEFPPTVFLRYKGYEMKYSRDKRWLFLKLLQQAPRILWQIKKENSWLNKVIEQYKIDAVISDNRFGMHSKKVPCIYITHQLL
ncbi:MAG: glycosyl transferase family 28, partial [Ginsengibacter sp.]